MAASSRQIDNFTPVAYPKVIPVTVGNVNFIYGCSTPDNHGVIVWTDPDFKLTYSAVVPISTDMMANDVITDLSQCVVIADRSAFTPWEWTGVTVFQDGANLYAITSGHTNEDVYTDIYIADDVDVPTAWTHLTEIQHEHHAGGLGFRVEGYEKVAEVTILSTGRWVWSGVYWHNGVIAIQPAAGIWTSDDQGVTWLNRVFKASDINTPFDIDGFFSSEICVDPVTDTLYWYQRGQSIRCYTSTDNGSTWTSNFVSETYVSLVVEDWANSIIWAYKFQFDGALYQVVAYDATADPLDPSVWTSSGVLLMDVTDPGTYHSWARYKTGILGPDNILCSFNSQYVSGLSGGCIEAPLLHIPYKERLKGVVLADDPDDPSATPTPTPDSLARASSEDFDNLKVIERWAGDFMRLASWPSRCYLNIPYKYAPTLDAAASFDNYKAIERWALHIAPSPDCALNIPHKTVLGDHEREAITFPEAQDQEFTNYKVIERWALRFTMGECCGDC